MKMAANCPDTIMGKMNFFEEKEKKIDSSNDQKNQSSSILSRLFKGRKVSLNNDYQIEEEIKINQCKDINHYWFKGYYKGIKEINNHSVVLLQMSKTLLPIAAHLNQHSNQELKMIAANLSLNDVIYLS